MKNTCNSCYKPKANFECPLCHEDVCKSCIQFMEDGVFSFYKNIPEDLSHSQYCPRCFDEKIAVPLKNYEELQNKAKDVIIFFKDESQKTRLFSRKEPAVEVPECLDREETILRLAFFAAEKKFNAIIDVDLKSHKVMNGSHRYSVWKGSAIPCHLDEKALQREY
jgi:hypothetical protein